jgi:anti-anti-sigma regulatory factor
MILSESLDIRLERRDGSVWLTLSGEFPDEQAPALRDKFLPLAGDGCRSFIIDMEGVTAIGDGVAPMFLALLNTVKGKGGTLKFIFKNDVICRAFLPYFNLFSIFPDADSLSRGSTILEFLKRSGKAMTRKTGFRISRPVALFALVVLCGWFLTLLYIIDMQNRRIEQQREEMEELSLWKVSAEKDMEKMRGRLQPLEQLGIIKDAPKKKP